MADLDRRSEPRVSRQELAAALAGGGARLRRLPTQPGANERAAAWDWSADERSDAELAELRETVSALRAGR